MTSSHTSSTSGLLVVEGQSDLHLVLHLCKKSCPALEANFNLHDAKGLPGLLASIRGFVNSPTLSAVGFLVDADDDPSLRWQEISDRLIAANDEIQLPNSPNGNGTVIAGNQDIGSPRIGVWIMPDNSSSGELEDFVVRMVPDQDPVWPHAQSYIGGISQAARKFDSHKVTKSEVHAWLAARKYPGLIGMAVREGDLDIDGDLTQTFLAWLTRLFA